MNAAAIFWQVVSLKGAALCLTAYAAGERWRFYKVANVVGAILLLAASLRRLDVGFIAMNAAWLVISLRRPDVS